MENLQVNVTLQEFSIIIESLSKRCETFPEGSQEETTLHNLITKLDRQGLAAIGFQVED